MQPVADGDSIQHIARITRHRHIRGRDHLIRAHKDAVRSDWSPADPRHADDFAPRLKSKKLHKRLLCDSATDDVDARLHQQANGGGAATGQPFPRKLEGTPVAVSLRNKEVMSPALSLTFP